MGYNFTVSTPIQISLSGIPSLWAVLFSIAIAVPVRGQPGTPDPIKASALKLPDGTVVFWTKNPEEANPTVEGVILSPQDYKALLEQAELARKVKALTDRKSVV